MKVAAVLFSTILAAVSVRAAPQQASTVSSVASSTVSLTPAQTCLAQCSAGDVTCEAACVGTAHPNASQVNATTQCAMACDQGDGSAAATQKYAECQQACIASYFPTSQTVVAVAGSATGTAASNAASATASGASTVSSGAATASATGSGTATGTAASATKTNAAANNILAGASTAGLVGLFMAAFAL